MATKYARLGEVSSGTMRPEDLIPCFLDALDEIREALAAPGSTTEDPYDLTWRVRQVSQLDDFMGAIEVRMRAEDYYESDESEFDLDELTDKLGEYAPPYCYFGTNEGDGACYGFWVSMDALNHGLDSGELYTVNAGDDWSAADLDGAEYVYERNDHGNIALYAPDGTEVWSCV